MSLGAAAWVSIVWAVVAGLVLAAVLWFIPNNAFRAAYDLLFHDPSPTISRSDLYITLMNQVDQLSMFVVTPLSMLVGGIALGVTLGEEYGSTVLYRWAAGCGTFINLALLTFLWGNKLVAQGMHLAPGQVTPTFLSVQLLALIFWIGMYVVGAEIGRRFHKPRATAVAA